MNSQDIISEKKSILQKLANRQLKEAIEQLLLLAENLRHPLFFDRITELSTNYKFMLHYQFEDVNDPQHDTVYSNLFRSVFEMTDDITDELLMTESSNLFFEKSRINTLTENSDIADYQLQLKNLGENIALTDLLDDDTQKLSKKRELCIKMERIASNMFNFVYVSKRADEKDYNDFVRLIEHQSIREKEKCLFVSALTLNLFHRFDARKMKLLMELCLHSSSMISQRAIVGLIVILQMYDVRWQFYTECQQQLDSLSENLHFQKSVLSVTKQLIRSRETEKISKKLTDEIIPEMMKFNSLAGKKLNMEELMGMTDDFSEKNPDWKKELENSGLADKLQEYSNLQMEGADVFHSTFSHLKSFPFFYDLSNWFLPFDSSYSELMNLFSSTDQKSSLFAAIVNSGQMCNSDKYSFSLSLMQMPESQRSMMLTKFGAESEDMKQLQQEANALNPSIDQELISNQYIQDLYRFFKLHPSKNGFFDIFRLRINFYDKKSIAPLISNMDDMKQIALYCFDKNFFPEALGIYQLMTDRDSTNSDIWQKIGYCQQMLGHSGAALDAYLHADLIMPNNSWIMKRIAQLCRSEKKYDMALSYFLKLQSLTPNNISVELNIGHCYLDMKNYDKALNTYFKVELLDGGDNSKAWRPIAWTAFLMKKYDIAQNYYRQIITNKATVHDYLNAGHVELVLNNKKEAIKYYLQTIAMQVNSMDDFLALFEADKETLVSSGIEENFFPLLFDELRYKLS